MWHLFVKGINVETISGSITYLDYGSNYSNDYKSSSFFSLPHQLILDIIKQMPCMLVQAQIELILFHQKVPNFISFFVGWMWVCIIRRAYNSSLTCPSITNLNWPAFKSSFGPSKVFVKSLNRSTEIFHYSNEAFAF